MLQTLIFNKDDKKVSLIDTDGNCYQQYPVSFNYWGNGGEHTAIENGSYPITHDSDWDMEYGHDCGAAYGDAWVAINRENGKGWHTYRVGSGRSMTSGTYGCMRSEPEDILDACADIDEALDNDIEVTAIVTGTTPDSAFCLDGDGEQ